MTAVDVRSLDDLLAHRYSCRGFLPEPVPMEIIEDVLALAQRTPSWCNTQAWQVHLITGAAVARFSGVLVEHAATWGENADLGTPGSTSGSTRSAGARRGSRSTAAWGSSAATTPGAWSRPVAT